MYYPTKITMIVPPGTEYTEFEKLAMPFRKSVWYLLVILLLISISTISGCEYSNRISRNFVIERNIRSPFLNLISIIFGVPYEKLPRRNFSRFLMTTFLLFCLVLQSLYQSFLLNFLQTDLRRPTVESI